MKLALLTLVVAMTSLSANAQRGRDRDIVFDRRPIVVDSVASCTYNLEKEEYSWARNRYVYKLEQSFTEFGRRACRDAEQECLDEKANRFASWDYKCTKGEETRVSRPAQICEYRIETRFGLDQTRYEGFGRRACARAENECLDDLDRRRSLPRWDSDWVGPRATCVQTTRPNPRPTPRPPRMVTASCRASLKAGRVGRDTGNFFTRDASARNFQEARQRACDEAMRACETQIRGRMFCEIVD